MGKWKSSTLAFFLMGILLAFGVTSFISRQASNPPTEEIIYSFAGFTPGKVIKNDPVVLDTRRHTNDLRFDFHREEEKQHRYCYQQRQAFDHRVVGYALTDVRASARAAAAVPRLLSELLFSAFRRSRESDPSTF